MEISALTLDLKFQEIAVEWWSLQALEVQLNLFFLAFLGASHPKFQATNYHPIFSGHMEDTGHNGYLRPNSTFPGSYTHHWLRTHHNLGRPWITLTAMRC